MYTPEPPCIYELVIPQPPTLPAVLAAAFAAAAAAAAVVLVLATVSSVNPSSLVTVSYTHLRAHET